MLITDKNTRDRIEVELFIEAVTKRRAIEEGIRKVRESADWLLADLIPLNSFILMRYGGGAVIQQDLKETIAVFDSGSTPETNRVFMIGFFKSEETARKWLDTVNAPVPGFPASSLEDPSSSLGEEESTNSNYSA